MQVRTTFRFLYKRIRTNNRAQYELMIGLKGFAPKDYIPLSTCAYANELKNFIIFVHDDEMHAQFHMKKVKDWFLERQRRQNRIRGISKYDNYDLRFFPW